MVLNMWQFTKGYVRISVTGFSIERFLNMAAYRGVYMWDVEHSGKDVSLNVSIKGFRMLKGCGRKTKCRTKIIGKNGLPFLLHRYRKRKFLMGGVLFFIFGLFALSSFIWRIELEGNETLHNDTVMAFLDAQGLRTGALKFRLDDRVLQQAILTNFPEVGWADVHTRGTRTTILISEAIPPQEIFDRQTPTHVIAATEGLITSIVASAGAPMVRQNDIVRPGDMLVSGILELEPDTPGTPLIYVHAHAEVWARRYHPIEFSVPFVYDEKVFTGQIANAYALQLLFGANWRINMPWGGNPFNAYDRITTQHQIGTNGNYPLPFVLVTHHYIEFTPQQRSRTIEEAEAVAQQMITNRIIREFEFGIDIINRQVNFEETQDALIVTALITTHERIDKQTLIGVE
ncbi:MAG: sporulation protein YqfD [Defluviitaleaceae bacterium]|nr:sporulation protein YqfD [Defluviitaleaceae bacterium]